MPTKREEIKLSLLTMIISGVVTGTLGFRAFFYDGRPIEGMVLLVVGGMLIYHFAKLNDVAEGDASAPADTLQQS